MLALQCQGDRRVAINCCRASLCDCPRLGIILALPQQTCCFITVAGLPLQGKIACAWCIITVGAFDLLCCHCIAELRVIDSACLPLLYSLCRQSQNIMSLKLTYFVHAYGSRKLVATSFQVWLVLPLRHVNVRLLILLP